MEMWRSSLFFCSNRVQYVTANNSSDFSSKKLKKIAMSAWNMTVKRELKTPLEVFIPNESNSQTFLVSLLGKEMAYPLLNILAEYSTNTATSNELALLQARDITNIYYDALREYFPSLAKETQLSVPLLREHLVKANHLILFLQQTGFRGQEHTVQLLNSVAFAPLDIPIRLQRFISNTAIDPRYSFELLRQEVLMLTSVAYTESRRTERTLEHLHTLYDLLENELFLGAYGSFENYTCYSVHDNYTNAVYAVGDDFTNIPIITTDQEHYKQHTLLVRNIEGIGPVVVTQREKRTEAALIKAIYKGTKSEENSIDIGLITDPSGMLFVTPLGKNHQLMQTLSTLIKKSFPGSIIETDHQVNGTRQQSKFVSFLRLQVYLDPQAKYPIELIIFDQAEYFHYLYHIGERQETATAVYPDAAAHALYELRRCYETADILFPQELYQYNPELAIIQRKYDQDMTADELLWKNRVLFPTITQT